MSILKNNMKRLLRDRDNLIVMVIMPVIFIVLFVYAEGGGLPLRIGVTDNDGTYLTQKLIDGLQKNCLVIPLREDEISDNLINENIEYAIKIDRGFTDLIVSGQNGSIQGYGIKDYNAFIPAKLYIESFIRSALSIAEASRHDPEAFNKGLDYYAKGNVSVHYENAIRMPIDPSRAAQSLGIIVMFMLYLGINAASLITEDKKLKTYERILTTPINLREYMLQNVLSFFAIIWIQVLMLFAITRFAFGVDYGQAASNIMVLIFIYSAVAVSLGMAIVNLAKTSNQVFSLTHLIVVPMCMLGGCFWPVWVMPDILQKLSSFVPVSWAVQGLEKILTGGSLASVTHEIIILLLFSLVFFLIGSAKKNSYA